MKIILHFVVVALIPYMAGCGGGSEVQRASVHGIVQFDGQPVESGVILFVPDPGVIGPPVQIVIEQGKYESNTATGPAVGSNSVQITASRNTGKEVVFQGVKTEEVLQYIPSKYNDETTLKAVVEAGENEFNFELNK